MKSMGGLLVVAFAIFGAPALLARFLVGGEWRQVGAAYALWLGFLALAFLLPKGGTLDEKLGWMTIIAMFLTIVAVPVLTLVQRLLAAGLNAIS